MELGATGPHLQLKLKRPTDVARVTGAGRKGREWDRGGESSGLLGFTCRACPGGHSVRGFTHSLFAPLELHGLERLQVLVQFTDHGNPSRQAQHRDSLFRKIFQMLDDVLQPVSICACFPSLIWDMISSFQKGRTLAIVSFRLSQGAADLQ